MLDLACFAAGCPPLRRLSIPGRKNGDLLGKTEVGTFGLRKKHALMGAADVDVAVEEGSDRLFEGFTGRHGG